MMMINGRVSCCTGIIQLPVTLILCTREGPNKSLSSWAKQLFICDLSAPVSRSAEPVCVQTVRVTHEFIAYLGLAEHDIVL